MTAIEEMAWGRRRAAGEGTKKGGRRNVASQGGGLWLGPGFAGCRVYDDVGAGTGPPPPVPHIRHHPRMDTTNFSRTWGGDVFPS